MITSPRQGLKKTETRAESPKNCSCSGGKRKPPWKSQEKWKYISVRVTTYNICDLRVAIFENSNLPLVATILEKCSRSKERFPFTSSISALFGMREHGFTNLFFLLNMEARPLNDWLLEDAVSVILMEHYQDLWYCYLCVYFDEFYLQIPMID